MPYIRAIINSVCEWLSATSGKCTCVIDITHIADEWNESKKLCWIECERIFFFHSRHQWWNRISNIYMQSFVMAFMRQRNCKKQLTHHLNNWNSVFRFGSTQYIHITFRLQWTVLRVDLILTQIPYRLFWYLCDKIWYNVWWVHLLAWAHLVYFIQRFGAQCLLIAKCAMIRIKFEQSTH